MAENFESRIAKCSLKGRCEYEMPLCYSYLYRSCGFYKLVKLRQECRRRREGEEIYKRFKK